MKGQKPNLRPPERTSRSVGSPHFRGTPTNKAGRRGLLGTLDWIFGLLVPGTLIKTCDWGKQQQQQTKTTANKNNV